MDENFQRKLKFGLGGVSPHRIYFFNFCNRAFPREHSEIATEFAGEFHTRRAGDGHLRGGMNRKIRREMADQPADADVLHDGRVHAGGDDGTQIIFCIGQFILKHQRVERDIAFHAAPVQKFHQLWQIAFGKIMRPHPRVEFVQAEVNGIRAIFHSGFGTFPVTGGREQFRQARRDKRF